MALWIWVNVKKKRNVVLFSCETRSVIMDLTCAWQSFCVTQINGKVFRSFGGFSSVSTPINFRVCAWRKCPEKHFRICHTLKLKNHVIFFVSQMNALLSLLTFQKYGKLKSISLEFFLSSTNPEIVRSESQKAYTIFFPFLQKSFLLLGDSFSLLVDA